MHFKLRELAKPPYIQLYLTLTRIMMWQLNLLLLFLSIKSSLLIHCCNALVGNVMLAKTLSFYIFHPAVCAHVHLIICCHLELYTPIIVNLIVLYRYALLTNCMITLHDHI